MRSDFLLLISSVSLTTCVRDRVHFIYVRTTVFFVCQRSQCNWVPPWVVLCTAVTCRVLLVVNNTDLGGGFTSRIYPRARSPHTMCYVCSSSLSLNFFVEHATLQPKLSQTKRATFTLHHTFSLVKIILSWEIVIVLPRANLFAQFLIWKLKSIEENFFSANVKNGN